MKIRHFLYALLIPFLLVCCGKSGEDEGNGNQNGQETQDPVDELAPEVKDGDEVLATNPNVDKFLNDIHYPTHDCSFTSLLEWAQENDVMVCPGSSDKPATYTIRWEGSTSEKYSVTLTEGEGDNAKTREYSVEDALYREISNLFPGAHYSFIVKDSKGEIVKSGEFSAKGRLHQLFFKSGVRNCRDLGGWATTDGKTVRYRMVYRGGRLEPGKIISAGKRDIEYEGIKAQLDLRGHTTGGNQEYLDRADSPIVAIFGDEAEFLAPCIEEGYSQMLVNDKEKTRQCMQFIMDCVDKNKPVYFHCSLGRDRTGTVAMLTLGILGVPEGDISQEYELTQFSTHGYATSEGEKTKMTRKVDYRGAADVIWGYVNEAAGETFRDGVEKYLIEIGISKADIDKFRSNMLQ